MKYYILKGKFAIPCDHYEWVRWQQTNPDRRVAFTDLDTCSISTVFLLIDHQWDPKGPPLLFETMVFGDGIKELEDAPMERYSTWAQAEAGHQKIVDEMRRRRFKVINGGLH